MVIAALALGGLFLATYLTLYHYGYIGTLACGTGACETVQATKYAMLAGFPVALWGAGYYASVLIVALLGTLGSAADRMWPTKMMLALNGWGVIFSGYLTWLEVAKINAICRYCVVSAGVVVMLFVLSAMDYRARTQRLVPK